MTVVHAPLISDGALSGLKAVYSPVSVKSFSEILLSPWLMFIDRRWDTECYATEIEQSALGAMTAPRDQVGTFTKAVVLLGNVMLRL